MQYVFVLYTFSYFIANAIQCYHCPHTSMQGIQDCSAVDGKLLECRGLYDSCYFAKGKICKLTQTCKYIHIYSFKQFCCTLAQTGKEVIRKGCHYDSQNGQNGYEDGECKTQDNWNGLSDVEFCVCKSTNCNDHKFSSGMTRIVPSSLFVMTVALLYFWFQIISK